MLPLLRQNITFSKIRYAIVEWNNFDPSLRISSVLKEKLLNFIRPSPKFLLIVTILKELNLLQDLDSV